MLLTWFVFVRGANASGADHIALLTVETIMGNNLLGPLTLLYGPAVAGILDQYVGPRVSTAIVLGVMVFVIVIDVPASNCPSGTTVIGYGTLCVKFENV